MTFAGWPDEALEFYEGLEADNSKTYWTAHKVVYESAVLAPMTALLDELTAEFGPAKVFRPYRDVRFSKDKSPYKTAIGAVIGAGYVQLSAVGLAVGTGMYRMAPDQVERYRQAVAADPAGQDLEQVISAVEAGGVGVHGHDPLKSAPRGFPADHPRIGLLRNRGLTAWQEWPAGAWLGTPEPRERVTGFLRAAGPLTDWLAAHVGPSAAGRPGR
jgi:uncharacterized protein (TIGR02453 family)